MEKALGDDGPDIGELLRDGESCSVDMLSIEIDLARMCRGELLVDTMGGDDVGEVEGEDAGIDGGGDGSKEIEAAIVAGVIVAVLFCFV